MRPTDVEAAQRPKQVSGRACTEGLGASDLHSVLLLFLVHSLPPSPLEVISSQHSKVWILVQRQNGVCGDQGPL